MELINERSAIILTASFKDITGAAVIPNSLTWRLDDINGVCLINDTVVVPTSDSYDIYIAGDYTYILDNSKKVETKIVTIIFNYGLTNIQCTGEYRFNVKSLHQIVRNNMFYPSGGAVAGGVATWTGTNV